MKGKKSFVLYADLLHTVEKLPPEKAGELFLHVLKYVNDQNPKTNDIVIEIAFEPIRQQLKRDLEKYQNIVERNKNNGSKGGRPKKPKKPSGLSGNPTKPKKPDNDNDSVNDNEIITVGELIDYALGLNKDNLFDAKKLETLAVDAFEHYSQSNWVQKNGNPIKKPKLVFYNNWFKSARERGELFPRIGDGLSPVLT